MYYYIFQTELDSYDLEIVYQEQYFNLDLNYSLLCKMVDLLTVLGFEDKTPKEDI